MTYSVKRVVVPTLVISGLKYAVSLISDHISALLEHVVMQGLRYEVYINFKIGLKDV